MLVKTVKIGKTLLLGDEPLTVVDVDHDAGRATVQWRGTKRVIGQSAEERLLLDGLGAIGHRGMVKVSRNRAGRGAQVRLAVKAPDVVNVELLDPEDNED